MTITRAQIEARRVAIKLGTIPYSQSVISNITGRRSDCSGLLSYVWNTPLSGPGIWLRAYSTETFWGQKQIFEIPRSELRPGDAIGYCGAGTSSGGGGHIALWRGHENGLEHIWDHGSGNGPKDRYIQWGIGTGWQAANKLKAWRFVHVMEDDGTTYDSTVPGQIGTIMFCDYGDGGEVVYYTQKRILVVKPDALPRFGADKSYGNEMAYALYQVTGLQDSTVTIKVPEGPNGALVDKQVPGLKVYGGDAMLALDKAFNAVTGGNNSNDGVTEERVTEIATQVATDIVSRTSLTVPPTA